MTAVPTRVLFGHDLTARDAPHIPLVEAAAAVEYVLGSHIAITREELAREAGRVLGFRRLGNRVRQQMEAGIALSLERGGCAAHGDVVTLPG